jgi:hypothetical protein
MKREKDISNQKGITKIRLGLCILGGDREVVWNQIEIQREYKSCLEWTARESGEWITFANLDEFVLFGGNISETNIVDYLPNFIFNYVSLTSLFKIICRVKI